MAFTPETFVVCSKFPLFRASCNLWLYVTSDTLDTCLTENYFQPRMNTKNQDSPEIGDIIQCIVSGGTIAYLVITAKTEKPYNITVERTYLENEAAIYDAIYTAADKGEQLYQTGVWYAKMYSDTVVPTGEEYEDRNYADFSQVDSDNNPIIVIYECRSGVWVEIQRITPPTEYNAYLPVTSKFWDIEEQTGQQGGEVLWSFNTKRFTPFPRIISYDSIHVTGDSTVAIPDNPSSTQIVNKDYVDTAIAAIPLPEPTVNINQSLDAMIVGTLTQNGTVFSGFTANDYIQIPWNADFRNPFEFVIGANFTSGSLNQFIAGNVGTFYSGSFALLYSGSTGELVFNGATGNVRIAGDVSTNTDYLIKLSWDGSDYKMFISTDDGETYTQLGLTVSYAGNCGYGDFGFGKNVGTIYYENFIGTIDFAKAYLKVGENIVWSGMDAPGLQHRVLKGHEVIEFQVPTAQNNYTWVRKYADGWVEQGGVETTTGSGSGAEATVNLPVTMSDSNYMINVTGANSVGGGDYLTCIFVDQTTSSFKIASTNGGVFYGNTMYWEVKGVAA